MGRLAETGGTLIKKFSPAVSGVKMSENATSGLGINVPTITIPKELCMGLRFLNPLIIV
jgi:hypothetical protein